MNTQQILDELGRLEGKTISANPKAIKIIDIFRSVVNTADHIMNTVHEYPQAHRGRRITRNFKFKRRRWKEMLVIQPVIVAARVAQIIAQPVPKYPCGGSINNGPAYIEDFK